MKISILTSLILKFPTVWGALAVGLEHQVSVLFVLCIEGYFVDAKIPRTYEKFRSGCFVYFVVAIVLYMAFFFKPELFALMKKQTALCYNLFFLMVTILIGFLCTLVISLEEYESKEKQ